MGLNSPYEGSDHMAKVAKVRNRALRQPQYQPAAVVQNLKNGIWLSATY